VSSQKIAGNQKNGFMTKNTWPQMAGNESVIKMKDLAESSEGSKNRVLLRRERRGMNPKKKGSNENTSPLAHENLIHGQPLEKSAKVKPDHK